MLILLSIYTCAQKLSVWHGLQARMDHNARVRMASIASEGRRARFLLNHIEVLLPFITPQAAAHIRCEAAS